MTEREIFLEALEMTTPEARAAYLQGACGQDGTLRRKVEELLKEHFANDSLLAGPAMGGERATMKLEPAPQAAPAQAPFRYAARASGVVISRASRKISRSVMI